MDEKEYSEYLQRRLKEICGDYLKQARNINSDSINVYSREFYNYEEYKFYVYERFIYSSYMVYAKVENYDISEINCTCGEYYDNGMCKHIAACLYNYIDHIIPKPPTKEEIKKQVFSLFKSSNDRNKIKEKMNLEIEVNLENNSFKMRIGLDKLYVLNGTKLNEFLTAYKKRNFVFGTKFVYDPNINYFSKEDEELFEFLSFYGGYTNSDELNKREMKVLLEKLKNKTFEVAYYGTINKIEYKLPEIIFLNKQDGKYILKVDDFDNINIANEKYILYKDTLYIPSKEEMRLINTLNKCKTDSVEFEHKDLGVFMKNVLPEIKNSLIVSDNVDDVVIASKPDTKIYIDFNRDKIEAKIKFDYKGNIIDYFDKKANIARDEETEIKVVSDLIDVGFINYDKKFYLDDIDAIGLFFESGLTSLADKYEIFTSKKIDDTKFQEPQKVKSTFSIGMDGIMSYSFDTGEISDEDLSKIFSSLKAKKKYYRLKNGNILKLEENNDINELQSVFDDLNIKLSDFKDGKVEIPKYRAFYIDSLKNNKYGIISSENSFDEFIDKFKKYKNVNIEFDEFDDKTLRDYQKDGVKWLYTLYKCDLGGILADEMGLGKSIQTISLIKQVIKEKNNAKIMIVCPTALIYNWKKEFDKFGENLKYAVVAENKINRKEIIDHFDDYNVFITSYGLIRNDNDEYENKRFDVCIIDEAQAIKNYQAGMTKEVKKINASTKFALTGTPIENSVFELWSIFDFIMPGYLNNINKFRENYGIKEVDSESLERLANLNYQIKPFILRRKKSEVSESLPEKIENNIYLDLPENQKKLYMKIVHETQKEMDEIIATSGFQAARFKILQLLTRLREVCIDPNILFENYDGESIKMERLLEIVKDLVADNHKILIFSSFKTVINNVKKMFDKESISNYVIAGDVKSKERMQLVELFNNNDVSCFLITLKSGGTGLNLVGADIVIHLDIWWNPQAENQATDRAHRIGQTKNVTVIKLITKGTIEEKIIELQNKKQILSDNLIEGKNNSETISNLSEKEMKDLLALGQDE